MICDKLEECIKSRFASNPLKECTNQDVECVKYCDKRLNAKCEENRKIYNLKNDNKSTILLIKIDGGAIVEDKSVPSKVSKCDFLFIINSVDDTAILTELKGTDVAKSLKQIYDTFIRYKMIFDKMKYVYARSIVSSSTPKIRANPNYTKLQSTLKQHGGNLKIKERKFEECISKLSVE